MDYIDNLMSACKKAASATPTDNITFNWQSDSNYQTVLELIETFKARTKPDKASAGGFLYVIYDASNSPEETLTSLAQFKAMGKRNCPRINSPCTVMYVGSSVTDIKKRIREHLGFGSKSTYSLQLQHWFTESIRVDIKYYDVPQIVLQIIEDAHAHELKPAFGKMGGK